MTNMTVFNPTQLPAFARHAEPGALTKALAGGGGGFGDRLSIKGGVFRLIHDGKEVGQIDERHIDVVFVNAAPKVSRVYYIKKWDPDSEAVPPTCWSADGEKPDADVTEPQSANCASCPQNVAGSGEGEMRACRFQQRVAVVLADDIDGKVMQLGLPARSIFGKEENGAYPLQAYARWLAAQNIEANMVVTRMRFDTKVEQPKLLFRTIRWLTEDEYESAKEQGVSPSAVRAVEFTVAKLDGVQQSRNGVGAAGVDVSNLSADEREPAGELLRVEGDPEPSGAQAAAKRRGRPPGSKNKVVEEPAPEPTVRSTPQAAAPQKPSLSQLAAEWDADD